MDMYGLLGEKLSHSLSPVLHQELFELLNIPGGYTLFEVPSQRLADFCPAMRLLGVKGANVTIPYKQAIIPYLDGLSSEAKAIGAVNTLVWEDGRLIGHNTDYFGLQRLLKAHDIRIKGKSVAILGTGGVSKAAEALCRDLGAAEIWLVSRHRTAHAIDYDDLRSKRGALLLNATPVGMYPKVDAAPVDVDIIERFDVLVDLVYNPTQTAFLKLGEQCGKQTAGGLYMLVAQAVKSQELWQRRSISEEVLTKVYQRLCEEFDA